MGELEDRIEELTEFRSGQTYPTRSQQGQPYDSSPRIYAKSGSFTV